MSGENKPTRVENGVKFTGLAEAYIPPDIQYMARSGGLFSTVGETWVFVVVDDAQSGVILTGVGSIYSYNSVTTSNLHIRYNGNFYLPFANLSLGTRQLYIARFGSPEVSTAMNGGDVSTLTVPGGYNNNVSGLLGTFRIPSILNSSSGLNATLHELLVVHENLTPERYAEIAFYLMAKWQISGGIPAIPISGRLMDLRTGPSPTVTLFDWDAPETFARFSPSESGYWDAVVRPNAPYGLYYLSQDGRCPPIIHGPYTAE